MSTAGHLTARADADRRVSYAAASELAGLNSPRERGSRDTCPACGEYAYRGYDDHGYCFACQAYFTPVRLLAVAWEMEPDEAAAEAIKRLGLPPLDPGERWKHVQREPEPDLDELAEALRTWCAGRSPGWNRLQLDERVSKALSACLALLPRVRTEQECLDWLARTQQVMGRILDGMC